MTTTLKFNHIWRLHGIERWHMMPHTKYQSVAEHSFNVAMIALEITKDLELTKSDTLALLAISLSHDFEEAMIGDPSPIYKMMVQDPDSTMIEPSVAGWGVMNEFRQSDGSFISDIVKIADIAEALIFARDYGVGRYADECVAYCCLELTKALSRFGEDTPIQYESVRHNLTMITNTHKDPIL